MELSFKKVKKERFNLELPNGEKVTIKPPKYSTMLKFSRLGEEAGAEEVQGLVLEILNMNEQGRQFTQIEIDEMLDISDIYELITAFTNYMSGLINQKNSACPSTPTGLAKG